MDDLLEQQGIEKTQKSDSLLGGFWFYFTDEDRTIIVHGSNLFGRETIFIDSVKVIQKIIWRFNTGHVFDYKGDHYKVTLETLSYWKGILKVKVFKNGALLDSETRSVLDFYLFSGKKKNLWIEFLGAVLTGVLLGVTDGLIRWGFVVGWPSMASFLEFFGW